MRLYAYLMKIFIIEKTGTSFLGMLTIEDELESSLSFDIILISIMKRLKTLKK